MYKPVSITTLDGLSIIATQYAPAITPKAGIIINSATAVKQSYYRPFANFLAQNGYLVITYDYRGIGQSSLENSRDPRLTMQAWGEQDLASIIDWCTDTFSELDWHCIGHSVGGQLVGLAANNTKLKSIYCVSSQSGYWKHWESFNKAKVMALWYAVIPGLSKVFGKVPGFLLGGENLPAGIAEQWAYWGRNKDYIVDENGNAIREGFAQVACSMKFLLIDDDKDFAPPRAVKSLEQFYENADTKIEVINVKELGNQPVGHFGFFREQHENNLWRGVLDWFEPST